LWLGVGRANVGRCRARAARLFCARVSKEPSSRAILPPARLDLATGMSDARRSARRRRVPGDAAFAPCASRSARSRRPASRVVEKPLAADARGGHAPSRLREPVGVRPRNNKAGLPRCASSKRTVAAGTIGDVLRSRFISRTSIDPRQRRLARRTRANSPGGGMTGAGLHLVDASSISGRSPGRRQKCLRRTGPDPRVSPRRLVDFESRTPPAATVARRAVSGACTCFGSNGSAEVRDETTLTVRGIGEAPHTQFFRRLIRFAVVLEFCRDGETGPSLSQCPTPHARVVGLRGFVAFRWQGVRFKLPRTCRDVTRGSGFACWQCGRLRHGVSRFVLVRHEAPELRRRRAAHHHADRNEGVATLVVRLRYRERLAELATIGGGMPAGRHAYQWSRQARSRPTRRGRTSGHAAKSDPCRWTASAFRAPDCTWRSTLTRFETTWRLPAPR